MDTTENECQGAELPAEFERNVKQAVQGLLKLIEIRQKESHTSGKKRDLLADDDEAQPIYVQLSLKHIPEVRGGISLRNKQLSVSNLPHSLHNDSLSVCLVVADVPGSKTDREKTVRQWKTILEAGSVSCVNQLISARSLRTEYHTFEARRQLAAAFDTFLVDKRLRMRCQEWFGSAFFARGRIPICVRLNKRVENDEETERGLAQILGEAADSESESEVDSNSKSWLKDEFARAFRTTTLSLSVRGPCSNALIGYTTMSEQELTQNAAAFFRSIILRLPGGLANVRVAHVKSKQTRAVPFYYSNTASLSEQTRASIRTFEQTLSDSSAFRALKQAANARAPKRVKSKSDDTKTKTAKRSSQKKSTRAPRPKAIERGARKRTGNDAAKMVKAVNREAKSHKTAKKRKVSE